MPAVCYWNSGEGESHTTYIPQLIIGLLVPVCFNNCRLDLFIVTVLLFPKRLLGRAHRWGVGMWDSYRQNLFILSDAWLCTNPLHWGWGGKLGWKRWFWFRCGEDPCLLMLSPVHLLPPGRM